MSEPLELLKCCILFHGVGAMAQPYYIAGHVTQGGIDSVQGQGFGHGVSVSTLERNTQCRTTVGDRRQIRRRQTESHTGLNCPAPSTNECGLLTVGALIFTLVDTVIPRLIRTSEPGPQALPNKLARAPDRTGRATRRPRSAGAGLH